MRYFNLLHVLLQFIAYILHKNTTVPFMFGREKLVVLREAEKSIANKIVCTLSLLLLIRSGATLGTWIISIVTAAYANWCLEPLASPVKTHWQSVKRWLGNTGVSAEVLEQGRFYWIHDTVKAHIHPKAHYGQKPKGRVVSMLPLCRRARQLEPMWEPVDAEPRFFVPWLWGKPWLPGEAVPRASGPRGPPALGSKGALWQPAALSSPCSLLRGCCGPGAAAALFEMIIFYAVTVEYCSIFCNCGLHASSVQ